MSFRYRPIKLRMAVHECGRKNREVARGHTDDGVLLRAQANLLPYDAFIRGEAALPEFVGQDEHLIFARDLFFGEKSTTEAEVRAKQREVPVADLHAVDAFRRAVAEKRGAPGAERNDVFERMILRAVIVEIGERKLIACAVGGSAPKEDEAARFFEREVAKENAARDAEDCGIRADAESECQNGGSGKAGGIAKGAESDKKIPEKKFEQGKAARIAVRFLRLLRTAKTDASLARGFLRRHAATEIFFGGQLEMSRHLGLEFVVQRARREKGTETRRELQKTIEHGRPPFCRVRGGACFGYERDSYFGSLISERDERIDASSALRGNVSGQNGNAGKNGEHGGEGRWIAGPGFKEKGRDPLSGDERDDGADGDAHESETQCVVHDAEENVAAAGAERHANADFLALPRDHIGDDAVNAERGEEQAERGERTDEHDEEAARRRGSFHDLLQHAKFADRPLGIKVAHGFDEGGPENFRAQLRADNEFRPIRAGLRAGLKHFRSSRLLQAILANVRNHSNDDAGIFAAAIGQFSDGILAGPLHFCGGFIDDDGVLRIGTIESPIEIAAVAQMHSHRVEVTGRDDTDVGFVEIRAFILCGHVSDREKAPGAIAAEREHVGNSRGFDARNSLDATKNFLHYGNAVRGISIVVITDGERGGLRRLQSEIHVQHAEEAAEKQARANKEHASERHFADDEERAESVKMAAFRRAPAGAGEAGAQIRGGDKKTGSEAEQDRGKSGDAKSPEKRCAVDPHGIEKGQCKRGLPRDKCDDSVRENKTDGRSRCRQNDALR